VVHFDSHLDTYRPLDLVIVGGHIERIPLYGRAVNPILLMALSSGKFGSDGAESQDGK
jgi:hypothetical protein